MAILVRFTPDAMSASQYDEVIHQLESAGAGAPEGRLYHIAVRAGTNIQVVDVWESPESFEQFGQTLMPLLQRLGVHLPAPEIQTVHNVITG